MAVRAEDALEEVARKRRAYELVKRGFLTRGKQIDNLRAIVDALKDKHKRERLEDLHYLLEIRRHLQAQDRLAAIHILNYWITELEGLN